MKSKDFKGLKDGEEDDLGKGLSSHQICFILIY